MLSYDSLLVSASHPALPEESTLVAVRSEGEGQPLLRSMIETIWKKGGPVGMLNSVAR